MVCYERYNTGDDTGYEIYDNWWLAQTFTVGNTGINEDHTVDSVKLKVYRNGSPGIVIVAIYAVDEEGKPRDPLCHIEFDGNELPTSMTWVEFMFTEHPVLLANTKYAIVVNAEGDPENFVAWQGVSKIPQYTGGVFAVSQDAGGNWELDDNVDLMFEEYGTSLLVPELCIWLAEHGAPNISLEVVSIIAKSYESGTSPPPPPECVFIPTVQNVFGVIDYYLGFDGDAATGCDFYP